MSKGTRLKKKLNKKIIKRRGMDTKVWRFSVDAGQQVSNEVDMYGEPNNADGTPKDTFAERFEKIDVRIVVEDIKLVEDETSVGGIPSYKKEKMTGYFSSDFALRIGDKVEYPADSGIYYDVDKIMPNVLDGVEVILFFEACRDARNYSDE